MMTSKILKLVDFTKTQKSRYLESKALFFLRIKKSLIAHQGLLYGKKYFCRTAMNAKVSMFVFPVEVIYSLLCNLHDCTFKSKSK